MSHRGSAGSLKRKKRLMVEALIAGLASAHRIQAHFSGNHLVEQPLVALLVMRLYQPQAARLTSETFGGGVDTPRSILCGWRGGSERGRCGFLPVFFSVGRGTKACRQHVPNLYEAEIE